MQLPFDHSDSWVNAFFERFDKDFVPFGVMINAAFLIEPSFLPKRAVG